MQEKFFYFRCDASPVIGVGHLARCLNLAKRISAGGYRVVFLSRNLPRELIAAVESAGFDVLLLPTGDGLIYELKHNYYASSLGVPEDEDISQCESLIEKKNCAGLIVDHYGIGEKWLLAAKKFDVPIVVFDDTAKRQLYADIVINQNPGWETDDYVNLTRQGTKLLIGPQYAALSDEYSSKRKLMRRDANNLSELKVLISFGGSDIGDVSGKIISILVRLISDFNFRVSIAVGSMNSHNYDLDKLSRAFDGRIRVLENIVNLADYVETHDFAVGAAGISALERCCLGLPSIFIPIADNQTRSAKALSASGAGILVDLMAQNFDANFIAAFETFFDEKTRRDMSRNAMAICDGEGANRIANVILNET